MSLIKFFPIRSLERAEEDGLRSIRSHSPDLLQLSWPSAAYLATTTPVRAQPLVVPRQIEARRWRFPINAYIWRSLAGVLGDRKGNLQSQVREPQSPPP
eukprot:SAG11_NODE_20903_length_436_cov_0.759644_1_plen_98_part_10